MCVCGRLRTGLVYIVEFCNAYKFCINRWSARRLRREKVWCQWELADSNSTGRRIILRDGYDGFRCTIGLAREKEGA